MIEVNVLADQTQSQKKQPISPALEMAYRTLAILEEQVAGYTKLDIPVYLQIQLEEKRREVAELESNLSHE